MMGTREVEAITARVLDAHPHLQLVHRLVLLRREENFSKQDLVALVQRDPQLAPRVRHGYLRSERQNVARATSSVRDLIDRWGYRYLHSSSMVICFASAFHAVQLAQSYADYWRHCMAVGFVAPAITARGSEVSGDHVSAGALFASLGWFLLHRFAPDHFALAEQAAERYAADAGDCAQPDAWDEVVRGALGFHPDDVVRRAIGEWGLPEWLLGALAPPPGERCTDRGLRDIARAASGVAHDYGWGPGWRSAALSAQRPDAAMINRLCSWARVEDPEAWVEARVNAQMAAAYILVEA